MKNRFGCPIGARTSLVIDIGAVPLVSGCGAKHGTPANPGGRGTGSPTVKAVDATLHLSLPVGDLPAARRFYEDGFGCRVGRVRDQWIDVWFFGLQLTLQTRPEQVRAVADQGCRHFGVVLDDPDTFWALVARLRDHGVEWISEPHEHEAAELSGKV